MLFDHEKDFLCCRIGYAIAKKLAEDGAHVVVSSRKQKNVDKAVEALKSLKLSVTGVVCHVAKREDRQKLLDEVQIFSFLLYFFSPTTLNLNQSLRWKCYACSYVDVKCTYNICRQ